ncbi:MAG: COX15/CtaA family protein, partial [Burkholderiales bacterium]|nr:COX15/CtaA family protein [Burkholderiales bacterium]
ALLAALLEQQRPIRNSVRETEIAALILPASLALIFVVVQIALGGWVSTNYAALACHDYPLCNNEIIPTMDFQHGFTLWRKLGQTADGEYLPFTALVAIQWVHRNFALLVFAIVVWTGWKAVQTAGFRVLGYQIILVVCAQVLIGISTVYFSWPLLLAVLHNGGAALLLLLLTMLNYRVRHVGHAAY